MVSSVNNVTPGALTSTAAGGTNAASQLGFDTYLRLLVTQLKNQDPLNPMDGSEFTKELATFSQLEQQIKGNSFLEQLTKTQDYGTRSLATSYLSKATLVPGTKMEYVGQGTLEFGYALEKPAYDVKVEIVNSSGSVVRTLDMSGKAGPHVVEWDGKNEDGDVMPEGQYSLRASARNVDGAKVPVTLYTYGIVTAVTGQGSDVFIETHDGRTVEVDDVLAVRLVSAG